MLPPAAPPIVPASRGHLQPLLTHCRWQGRSSSVTTLVPTSLSTRVCRRRLHLSFARWHRRFASSAFRIFELSATLGDFLSCNPAPSTCAIHSTCPEHLPSISHPSAGHFEHQQRASCAPALTSAFKQICRLVMARNIRRKLNTPT